MSIEHMQFDDILTLAATQDEISIPELWAQGRTVYGGLSAGLLCDAVARDLDPGRRLRYLKIGFLRPLETEKPFSIKFEEVSAGRTVAVRTAEIIQDGVARVSAQANFVSGLDSDITVETFEPPELRPHNAEGALKMGGPGFPAFTRFVDFHTTTPGLPFQGSGQPELGGWMRFATAPESLTESHLVCLIDAWPPVPVSYYEKPVPLSSINWGIHFAEPVAGVSGEEFLGYLARVNFFSGGYGSSAADIWSADGRLLAKSFQTFLIYG